MFGIERQRKSGGGTINTQNEFYCHNHRPFGVASAPSTFQLTTDCLLQGIPGVHIYLNDIPEIGKTDDEHLQKSEEVLSRLENAGLRLKCHKCAFMLPSVEYLRHRSGKYYSQVTEIFHAFIRITVHYSTWAAIFLSNFF